MDKSRQHKPTFTRNIICFLVLFFILIFALHKCFSEGVTPLMKAAADGNVYRLKTLIKDGVNVNAMSRYNWTALMFASWYGYEKAVVLLLKAGADPNLVSKQIPARFETTSGPQPSTALAKALERKHISIAHILIDNGACIDERSLAMAGRIGDVSLFKKLQEKGVNFSRYSWSPLGQAAENGKLQLVKWLIKNGVSINCGLGRNNPLLCAVKGDQPDVVKYLLEHGANPNLVIDDYTHDTPITCALYKFTSETRLKRNFDVIKLLLEHGANPNQQTSYHSNPALIVLKKNINYGVKELKSADLDPEVRKRLIRYQKHDKAILQLLEQYKSHSVQE